MTGRTKAWIWAIVLGIFGSAATVVTVRTFRTKRFSVVLGSIVRNDTDPRKQQPVAYVKIATLDGRSVLAESDSAGFFRLNLNPSLEEGESLTLRFRHPDYEPQDVAQLAGEELWIVRMVPLKKDNTVSEKPEVSIADVRVRYSTKMMTTVNVGSVMKTFEVANKGNVPCNGAPACSPDGRWKAAIESLSLDAGENNEFRNPRISCIAGPCPFTRIEPDGMTGSGRALKVSVRNWSDTTTFLVEAEVVHAMMSDMVRRSYPVIFGQAMNFMLPGQAVGPSIEAEVDGAPIVFPLGPNLMLSWAVCSVKKSEDQARLYRCELKPGYQFKNMQAVR